MAQDMMYGYLRLGHVDLAVALLKDMAASQKFTVDYANMGTLTSMYAQVRTV